MDGIHRSRVKSCPKRFNYVVLSFRRQKRNPQVVPSVPANETRKLSARPLTADGTTFTGRPRPRLAENLSRGLLAVFLTVLRLLIIAANSGKHRPNYTCSTRNNPCNLRIIRFEHCSKSLSNKGLPQKQGAEHETNIMRLKSALDLTLGKAKSKFEWETRPESTAKTSKSF